MMPDKLVLKYADISILIFYLMAFLYILITLINVEYEEFLHAVASLASSLIAVLFLYFVIKLKIEYISNKK